MKTTYLSKKYQHLTPEALAVLRATSRVYNCTIEQMSGRLRHVNIVSARQLYAWVIHTMYPRVTATQAGDFIERDHATILYSRRRAKERLQEVKGTPVDSEFKDKYVGVMNYLNGYDCHIIDPCLIDLNDELAYRKKLIDTREKIEDRILLVGQRIKSALDYRS